MLDPHPQVVGSKIKLVAGGVAALRANRHRDGPGPARNISTRWVFVGYSAVMQATITMPVKKSRTEAHGRSRT